MFSGAYFNNRGSVDAARCHTFLAGWSACLSVTFYTFLVVTLHPLAPPLATGLYTPHQMLPEYGQSRRFSSDANFMQSSWIKHLFFITNFCKNEKSQLCDEIIIIIIHHHHHQNMVHNFKKYLPCQNERKITDFTVQNFNTGSNGIKRSFVAK